jgi:hypothetical protein
MVFFHRRSRHEDDTSHNATELRYHGVDSRDFMRAEVGWSINRRCYDVRLCQPVSTEPTYPRCEAGLSNATAGRIPSASIRNAQAPVRPIAPAFLPGRTDVRAASGLKAHASSNTGSMANRPLRSITPILRDAPSCPPVVLDDHGLDARSTYGRKLRLEQVKNSLRRCFSRRSTHPSRLDRRRDGSGRPATLP